MAAQVGYQRGTRSGKNPGKKKRNQQAIQMKKYPCTKSNGPPSRTTSRGRREKGGGIERPRKKKTSDIQREVGVNERMI